MRKLFYIFLLILTFNLLTVSIGTAAQSSQDENEYWIKINKEQLRLTLYNGPVPLKSWQISIGRGRGPLKTSRFDLITPTGTFTISRVVQDASKLVYDPAWFNEPGEPTEGVYGSKLISFNNRWQIAIHGTNNPSSIGKWATHGCIRLRNRDIEDLVTYVKPKMKLVIIDKNPNRVFYKETI